MQRRRSAGGAKASEASSVDSNANRDGSVAGEHVENSTSRNSAENASTQQLRRPRHGGYKGSEPGREAKMLCGEPGYHIGIFRVAYGMLLVQRTLAFMSSGAVDASFSRSDNTPSKPGMPDAGAAAAVLNFSHGFIGKLGSNPSADGVRTACWCLCSAGAALSIGFRPNAMAFGSAVMQFYLLLVEKSLYTDEAYLFALIALLLSFVDCGKTLGLDAPRSDDSGVGGVRGSTPAALRDQPPDTVPHWHVVLLRFQVCVLHIHRGLAKAFTTGWLLEGQPLLSKLQALPTTHVIRRVAQWAASSDIPGLSGIGLQAMAVRVNVTVIFFNIFMGISLLAAPHYRPAALWMQTAVHLTRAIFGPANARPWHLLIAASGVLFLDPSMIEEKLDRVQAWLQPAVSYDHGRRSTDRGRGSRRGGRRGGGPNHGGGAFRAAAGGAGVSGGGGRNGSIANGPSVGATGDVISTQPQLKKKKLPLQLRPNSAIAALIFGYVLAQVLVPLRHLLNAFPVEWSRQGQEFAWRSGGGTGGRAGSGGIVLEEALVRVFHRSRDGGGKKGSRGAVAPQVQHVHLYGSPLTAQQVLRLVLDPDMLLQLAKVTAESMTTSQKDTTVNPNQKSVTRTPPYSHVDAWKSINGDPFSPWIDATVDVWDVRYNGEGPPVEDWLEKPPLREELDKAASTMEIIRERWAARNQSVTFFAARQGQALNNVFLGGYDPSNLNTTELCSVPQPPRSFSNTDAGKPTSKTTVNKDDDSNAHDENARGKGAKTGVGRGSQGDVSVADGGGILIGVVTGAVDLLTDPDDGKHEPKAQRLTGQRGETWLAPRGEAHSIRVAKAGSTSLGGLSYAASRKDGLAIWYYVHACPEGLFHLCIGFVSGAGWQELYSPAAGVRKGWVMEYGVPKR